MFAYTFCCSTGSALLRLMQSILRAVESLAPAIPEAHRIKLDIPESCWYGMATTPIDLIDSVLRCYISVCDVERVKVLPSFLRLLYRKFRTESKFDGSLNLVDCLGGMSLTLFPFHHGL